MAREAAEARAKAWGIPFSAETRTEDLEAMCAQMDQRRPHGTLEDFLAVHKLPTCCGVLWDAAGIKDCAICEAEYWCRQQFFERFDEHLRDHGLTRKSALREIAEVLGIHVDSAQLAMSKAAVVEPLKKSGIKFMVEQNGVQQLLSSAEIVKKVEQATGVSMQKAPEPPPPVPATDPEPVEAVPQELPAAPEPVLVAKKPKAKKPAAEPPPEAPVTPQEKKPAKTHKKAPVAAAAAGEGAPKAKAKKPKAPDGPKKPTPYELERSRNPKVAKLEPQTSLEWEYKGKLYRVQVAQGYYYLLDGKQYPTLTAIVAEIGGTKLYPQKDKDGNVLEGAPPKKTPLLSVVKAFGI